MSALSGGPSGNSAGHAGATLPASACSAAYGETVKIPGKAGIRLTNHGLVLAFLMVWIPISAFVTGNNFLFILLGLMLGLIVVSHYLAGKNLKAAEISRVFPEEVFADTPFTIRYNLTSRLRPWGSFALSVQELPPIQGDPDGAAVTQVTPGETTQHAAVCSIRPRGDRQVGPFLVSSSFPFGLASYSKMRGPDESVLVFPKIEPVEAYPPFSATGSGSGVERVDLLGTIPHHHRDYVAGDPYKLIDWKKSASSGQLVTRVLSEESARRIVIRLPRNASESAISRAASLVVKFGHSGIPLCLLGPGIMTEAGTGSAFIRKLLTILARWDNPEQEEPDATTDGDMVIDIDSGGEFIGNEGGGRHER